MMNKIKKCSLSKKTILGMLDSEIFSTNDKLTSLMKLSQTQCRAVPNFGELFEFDSSGSSVNNLSATENEDGSKNDSGSIINMLAGTISCVMLMASDFDDISENNLTWTERYLECIKDDDGVHPPNIQGILNHIILLKSKRNSDSDLSANQNPTKSEMDCQSELIFECSPKTCNPDPSFLYL